MEQYTNFKQMQNKKNLIKLLIVMLITLFVFNYSNCNNCNAKEVNTFISNEGYCNIFEYETQTLLNKHNNIILNIKDNFTNKLFDLLYRHENKNILIAIIGETASGKSTFVKEVQKTVQSLNIPISFVNTDNYYRDMSNIVKNNDISKLVIDGKLNLDCPEAFDLSLLKNDLFKLQNGTKIYSPKYSMDGTGTSLPRQIPIEPNNVIIVEGIASAYKDIFDIFDITCYVDINNNIRKDRFINRAKERQIKESDVNKFWDKVSEAGEKYIQPRKKDADIIINGEFDIDTINGFISYLYNRLKLFN